MLISLVTSALIEQNVFLSTSLKHPQSVR